MDGDEAAVAGAQDVRLRQARAVARVRHRAEREVRGKRLDGEMRHGLEHRDLDHAALAGAAALEQRAEHAIGGVDAGDRIGERRAEEARPLGIDHTLRKPDSACATES